MLVLYAHVQVGRKINAHRVSVSEFYEFPGQKRERTFQFWKA
jgi:hypothetical protein